MLKKGILLLSLVTIISFSCQNGGERPGKEAHKEAMAEYVLSWSDEFDGDQINPDNWSFEIWDAGKVNNEWQQYVKNPDNYKLQDGKLHITATRTGKNEKGGYASTRLSGRGKKEITYGRIEFRAMMPSGIGTWPALWMLGANINEVGWPGCGELVILEYVGFQPDTVHSNLFTAHQSEVIECHRLVHLPTAEDEFHIYGMTWTADSINFYLDDPSNIVNSYAPEVKTAENWPFDQPFFLIMNFAVGGDWGGKKGVDETIWPQSMIVDYVRVYQLNQKPEAK